MAVVWLQTVTPWGNFATPETSGSFTPTAGNALLAFGVDGSQATGNLIYTGSGTGTWSALNPPANFADTGGDTSGIGLNPLCGAGAQTITIASAGSTLIGGWALEYSGVSSATGNSGKQVNAPGTGVGAITGTALIVPVGSVLVAFCFDISGGQTYTADPAATSRFAGNAFGVIQSCVEEYAGTGASITPKFTTSSGGGNTTVQQVLLSAGGAVISAQGGRPLSRGRGFRKALPLSRLRSAIAANNSGITNGPVFASGASASTAAFALTATGLLAFTGASASSASFSLSGSPASASFSGSSASTGTVSVSGGIALGGSSASTANLSASLLAAINGSSASAASFSLLGSGVLAATGSSASTASFNAQAISSATAFTGSSASTASFSLSGIGAVTINGVSASAAILSPSVSVGFNGSSASAAIFGPTSLAAFQGSSASAAVFGATGNGLLTFNGSSASTAFVDAQALTSGSIFFFGASASTASLSITGPFTPPPVTPPSGGMLPGVTGKTGLKKKPRTAIEMERGERFPWQATGEPIVPSPFMTSLPEAAPPPFVAVVPTVEAPVTVEQIDIGLILLGIWI